MEIDLIKEISQIKKSYEKFIGNIKNADFFYNYFWLSFLEENFKGAKYIVAKHDSKIMGILPFFKEDSSLISMPYSAVGGPLMLKNVDSVLNKIIARSKDEARGFEALEINNISAKMATLLQKKGFIIFPFLVFPILELSTIKDFWNKTLKNSTSRKAIKKPLKKAEEAGLEVREVKTELDIKDYFNLEKSNMLRVGAEYKTLKFWTSLFKKVPKKNIKFLLVKYKNKTIAGRISFLSEKNKTIQNYRGVSLKEYQHFYPNEFMHHYLIEWAIKNGYKSINFGASGLKREGSYIFKKKFANKDIILWSAVYPLTEKKKKEIIKFSKEKKKEYEKFLLK